MVNVYKMSKKSQKYAKKVQEAAGVYLEYNEGDSTDADSEAELGKRWTPEGKRILTCPKCPHKGPFSSWPTLQAHFKGRHRGEKVFRCEEEGCGKVFATKGTLKKHQRNHEYTPEQL